MLGRQNVLAMTKLSPAAPGTLGSDRLASACPKAMSPMFEQDV